VTMHFLKELGSKIAHIEYRLRSRQSLFTAIYCAGGFAGDGLPPSGAGSTIAATKLLRPELEKLLQQLGIKSLLDAPCGDFTWMQKLDRSTYYYTGIDIVKPLIEQNQRLFSDERTAFINADIVKDKLPNAEFILCRDCFIHLSNSDIVKAISNFKRSGARYLLTTTFTGISDNKDMVSGRGWRPLNFVLQPFNFPQPIRLLVEGCTEGDGQYSDKCLGLWNIEDL
jgi:hypothetical protein